MHQGTTTTTMGYPSLPASPTLTNPDMILPYGEYDSTPSPPRRSHSPNSTWKGTRPADMDFSLGLGGPQMGLGPMTPITPIIYGNGTMLSDIGEVTEAESTLGTGSRRIQTRISKLHQHDSPVKSSPTIDYAALKRSKSNSHQRTVSIESTSTIMTMEEQSVEMFEDFDDAVSVDDSNFQGDDEESVVDEGYRHAMITEVKTLYRKESRILDADDEALSSAALSSRAEMILANAKKRLDKMEGNLSRARGSLHITPSSSMSSIHSSSPLSRSTPSPPAAARIVPQMGNPPARHRQMNTSNLGPNSPGHYRVSSENSIAPTTKTTVHIPRSVSTGVKLTPSPKFESDGIFGSNNSKGSPRKFSSPLTHSSNSPNTTFEVVNDDDASPGFENHFGHERASTAEPYAQPDSDHRGLTRSASSMQMRDLTDKMTDLKSKISILRDRAREDNMKRRSVQSLRTPSPFTAAEQWYTGAADYKSGGLSADASISQNPWNLTPTRTETFDIHVPETIHSPVKEMPKYEGSEAASIYQDVVEEQIPNEEVRNLEEPLEDPANNIEPVDEQEEFEHDIEEYSEEIAEEINGGEAIGGEDEYEDEYEDEIIDHGELDGQSDGAESLYHDTFQAPISHEDREDAFDYEHFFLHSAMGTISQQAHRRDSTDGYDSEDSVETTRGPETSAPAVGDEKYLIHPQRHSRNQSTDTVSTMATFATATESFSTAEDIASDDEVPENALGSSSTSTSPESARSTTATSPPPSSTRASISAPSSRPSSVIKGGIVQPHSAHRPSVSSFASTVSNGTTRSFPLVNKPKSTLAAAAAAPPSSPPPVGPLPPAPGHGGMPGRALSLNRGLNGAIAKKMGAGIRVGMGGDERDIQPSPVSMLVRDDQILVERLVASLGQCVLGLQEASRGSYEGRVWRRRLDAARRVLDGEEGAV